MDNLSEPDRRTVEHTIRTCPEEKLDIVRKIHVEACDRLRAGIRAHRMHEYAVELIDQRTAVPTVDLDGEDGEAPDLLAALQASIERHKRAQAGEA